jgi:hypothetical protein
MKSGWASNWLAQQSKKIKLSPAQLCPCGSGWVIASCCLDTLEGRLRKRVSSLEPPGCTTNFSHPGCYLRDTNNCSDDISREHYISASVLEQIAASEKAVNISGLPFLAPGETKALSVESLTAKILCQRHNSALSPLDQEAGRFFQSLTEVTMRTGKGLSSSRLWLASGTMLELWMLKVACGLYFSRLGSSQRNRIADTHSIDMKKVIDAFFRGRWDERGGLYFNGDTGTVITTAFHLQAAPLTDDLLMRMGGVRVSLLGFECDLVFDTSGTNQWPWSGVTHRPHELIFERGNSRKTYLLLSWPNDVPESAVHFGVKPFPRATNTD